MASFDLTYRVDQIDSSINVSEDGVYSISKENDSPQAFNKVVSFSAEEVLLDNLDGEFEYVVILNEDATNFIRVRTFLTGSFTVDEKCLPGTPMIIPSRQYWADSTAAARDLVNAESISVQADTAAVNITVYFIR